MALKRRKKKRKHAKVNDDLIDLDKIIKIDSFSLTNNYDPKAVLYILNKKNKLDLTMDDVVFDSFDDHEAKLRAKNTEKYKGRKTIYYEQSRNIGFIIWLIFSLILFFAGIAILLPLGIM